MDYKQWVKKYKKYLLCILCVVLLVFVLLLCFFKRQSQVERVDNLYLVENSQEQSSAKIDNATELLYADVKGAVKQPGIYEIKQDMRVWDVVQLAGGVKEKAETKNVNFAEKVSDQMIIYIPNEGEVVAEISQEVSKEQNQQSNKINLNQANEADLQTLTGIGQKKAQEIIAYREENGEFKEIDELKNISGIGDKTFEKLKESICVK